jgi:nucleotide-binding universal stress UspA family protein
MQRIIDGENRAVEDYLEGAAAWLRGHGLTVHTDAVFAPPASAIIDAAVESPGETMVAMTTHGRTGLARFALGSVASLVIREVAAPVFLTRPLTHAGGELDRFLVPLDGSPVAEAVLPVVSAVAPAFHAQVRLLMVGPVDDVVAEEYLQSVVDHLRGAGVGDVGCEIVPGSPATAILEEAQECGAKLIAMATHGRSGLRRWVFGSVADEIIHSAGLPTLIVRGHAPSGAER